MLKNKVTTKQKIAKVAKQNKKKKRPRQSSIDEGFLSSTEYEIESRKIQYGYYSGY